MKTHILKSRRVLVLSAAILMIVCVAGIMATKRESKKPPQEARKVIDTLPPIISKVKDLEVLSATIKRKGQPDAMAAIEIKNNSDMGMTAVDVTSGEYGMTVNGLDNPAHPVIVIKPHDTLVVEVNLNNIDASLPILVAAAIYADGTEVGESSSLQAMRGVREHDKAQREAQQRGEIPR
jgi:hypothetical protein